MKTRSTHFLAILLSIPVALAVGSTASASDVCDASDAAKAKFLKLRDARIAAPGSVSSDGFRDASQRYIDLAEECYESEFGTTAATPIDDGGLWANPDDEFVTQGTKWGAGSPFFGGQSVPGPGLPGGTVTYSFMADGVSMAGHSGANVAITSLPSYAACFDTEITNALDAWSAVSDIQFQEVPDNGVPFDAFGAQGDIRIGAHFFDGPSGVLAHAFFPPPNGNTAAGDMHFDSGDNWSCDASGIDFGVVTLHELGHAIGLGHQNPPPTASMNPFYNPAITLPLADDIQGAESIYGPPGTCNLNVDLTYAGGILTMDFDLQTTQPVTWTTLLYIPPTVTTLWSLPIPAVDPSVPVSLPVPFPALGDVTIVTVFHTPTAIQCVDFETVNTN